MNEQSTEHTSLGDASFCPAVGPASVATECCRTFWYCSEIEGETFRVFSLCCLTGGSRPQGPYRTTRDPWERWGRWRRWPAWESWFSWITCGHMLPFNLLMTTKNSPMELELVSFISGMSPSCVSLTSGAVGVQRRKRTEGRKRRWGEKDTDYKRKRLFKSTTKHSVNS